jgi:type I restriction enzyme, S subunit
MAITAKDEIKKTVGIGTENVKIPAGYKLTELGIVPKDWKVVLFSDLLEFRNGVNADKMAYGKGIPFINILEIITHTHLSIAKVPGRITLSRSVANLYSVQYGDIFFNRTSETQEELGLASTYISKSNEKIVFGGFVIRGRLKGNRIDAKYSGYAFRAPLIRSQIVSRGQGAIRANIGQYDLSQVSTIIPSLKEQQAIAAAISDIDSLITNFDQLIAKKRDIKQAAMQQLLAGKKRLPGFSGEWKSKRLRDFCEVNKGTQINKSLLTNVDEYPVWNGGITPSGYTEKWNTKENTITISEGGNSCGFVNFCSQKFWCGGHCYSICQIKQNVDQLFLFQKLKQTQEVIMGLRVGSGLPNIQKKNLLNLEIGLPEDNEEQAVIANILSDMDDEISSLEQQLDKTRNIKQGMMQELLTGRIRLI